MSDPGHSNGSGTLHRRNEIIAEEISAQNIRHVISLGDGATVEAVLYRGDTLCISSQVGCVVGCGFCASGDRPFGRNLTPDELHLQLRLVAARGHGIRRTTVSGVGEPLHNQTAVADFATRCKSAGTPTSITTSGGPLPRLRTWLEDPLVKLHNGVTVSVHAGTEDKRASLLPRAPALAPLFATLAETVPAMSNRRRKKIALAYLLLAGVNDSDAELEAFAHRAAPLGLAVHLYAHNRLPGRPTLRAQRNRFEAAYDRLRAHGLLVRMGSTARIEGNGGCGTLLARHANRSPPVTADGADPTPRLRAPGRS